MKSALIGPCGGSGVVIVPVIGVILVTVEGVDKGELLPPATIGMSGTCVAGSVPTAIADIDARAKTAASKIRLRIVILPM